MIPLWVWDICAWGAFVSNLWHLPLGCALTQSQATLGRHFNLGHWVALRDFAPAFEWRN